MSQKKLLISSIILFVLTSIGMAVIDGHLRNDVTPYGIVSFEFIRSMANANAAMAAWSSIGQTAAGISLGLDYLYLVLYTIVMSLFLLYTSEKVDGVSLVFGRALRLMAYLFPLVGILDAIENFGLIMVLLGAQKETWPLVAYYCALLKFAGFGVAVVFIIAGQVYGRVRAGKA